MLQGSKKKKILLIGPFKAKQNEFELIKSGSQGDADEQVIGRMARCGQPSRQSRYWRDKQSDRVIGRQTGNHAAIQEGSVNHGGIS